MATTQAPPMAMTPKDPDAKAEDNARTGKAPAPVLSNYVVLTPAEQEKTWEELGTIKAHGPDAARSAAVKQFDLDPEGLTLVAVSERYWKPKTGKTEQRDPVVVFS